MNRRDVLCLMGTAATGLAATAILAPKAAGAAAPRLDTFLSSFRVDKRNPRSQSEVDLHCMRLNEDVFQCVVFQGGGKLIGVEYVITDRLYRRLPLEEKAYWHPHAHEVLAGQLIAPNLPPTREEALMRDLVATWGKTWQTWPDPASDVPEGEPLLMWSVTGDGQLRPELLDGRDRRLGVSTEASRSRRRRLGRPVPQADPPESVLEIGRPWEAAGMGRGRS